MPDRRGLGLNAGRAIFNFLETKSFLSTVLKITDICFENVRYRTDRTGLRALTF